MGVIASVNITMIAGKQFFYPEITTGATFLSLLAIQNLPTIQALELVVKIPNTAPGNDLLSERRFTEWVSRKN